MAASMASRSLLFKNVLSSPFGVSALSKQFASYSPKSVKSFDEIPGPPRFRTLWKIMLGEDQPTDWPQIYAKHLKDFGPLVKDNVFVGHTVVHVFDPQDMKRIYDLEKSNYPIRPSHAALDEYRFMNMYKSGGLPCMNGKMWDDLRKALGNDLFREHHKEALDEVAEEFLKKIKWLCQYSVSQKINLYPLVYYWAVECTTSVVLGQSWSSFYDGVWLSLVDKFIENVHESQKMIYYSESLPPIFSYKYRHRLQDLQDEIYYILQKPLSYPVWKRYEHEKMPTSLTVEGAPVCLKNSMAVHLMDKGVDDREVRAFIVDCFQAGIHKPAHTLAFALYHLAKNPDVQQKVRKAVAESGTGKDWFGLIPACKEIENVILETMRLNPPTIGTGRVLPEPLILSGYIVPRGTSCILHHQVASKQEKYFKDPEKFNPDRFNEELTEEAQVANSPFARGDRACLMKEMAMTELCITLNKIMTSFSVSDYSKEDVGINSRLLNEPDRDIRLMFVNSELK